MRPDFARTDAAGLDDSDLRFVLAHFPSPAESYEDMAAGGLALPDTIESMLSSPWLLERILDARETILRISPFLLFSALVRASQPERPAGVERAVASYLANLLALFVDADRVYQVQAGDTQGYEYLVDLLAEAENAGARRRFLIDAHIGNHAIFISGVFARRLRHRARYGKSTVSPRYYVELGASGFHRAAGHRLAHEYGLGEVFLRLAVGFEHYRATLERMARRWLAG